MDLKILDEVSLCRFRLLKINSCLRVKQDNLRQICDLHVICSRIRLSFLFLDNLIESDVGNSETVGLLPNRVSIGSILI